MDLYTQQDYCLGPRQASICSKLLMFIPSCVRLIIDGEGVPRYDTTPLAES